MMEISKAFRPYYTVPGLYVAFDGKTVKREYPRKSILNPLNIHRMVIQEDEEGNSYVLTHDKGRIRVDRMVATCFCAPAKDGSKKYIIHKDRDKKNCDRSNLKFVTRDEYRDFYRSELTYTDDNGESWLWSRGDYYVTSSGKVRHGDTDLTIDNLIPDSDLDKCVPVSPFVCLGWKHDRISVDELVADAYCPKLPDVDFQVILHIDQDMMNCSASNLKWVEPDDPDYLQYEEKRKKYIDAIKFAH